MPHPDPLVALAPVSLPLANDWRFAIDAQDAGEAEEWFAPAFDDGAWTSVTVPHTWNVMPEYSNFEGRAWYRRAFTLPAEAAAGHVALRFQAVFYLARVWLNGVYLGEHEGGYTPFEFDVSHVARPGADNVLAVQVDNARSLARIPAILRPGWSFDWWNYGGIVRDVEVAISSRAFIAGQRVLAVPHLAGPDEADAATITATISVMNTASEALAGTLTARLRDDNSGPPAGPVSATVSLPAGGQGETQLSLTLPAPKLWHFDHPNLYHWSVTLAGADGQALDVDEVTIGIRQVELKDARFYLNGEPVRLVGLTRHADSPEHGLAETTAVMAADYDDLKQLNEVLSRPVHYPQAEYILNYADRNGILLIPEVPAWQLTADQMANEHVRDVERQQLREMIAASANHPSVWAWSIGNEIESETTAGQDFVRDMIAYVKSLDPTRPVGFASNRLGGRPWADATALSDFVLMNQYFGTWVGPKDGLGPALDAIHTAWPDKTVIISEFGFEPRWQKLWAPPSFASDPTQFYSIPESSAPDSEAADAQRRQLIAEQMAVYRAKPFVAGAIFWTYQDYRTRTDFVMGVVDAERQRRGSWAVLREAYAPVLFDSVAITPAAGGVQSATITLRTRGPVDEDLPAYTLRGYRLRWMLTAPDGPAALSDGGMPLPVLAPGTTWSTEIEWPVPNEDYRIVLSIVRPTGFTVIERTYHAQGDPAP
jgi:beta-glucuronidase